MHPARSAILASLALVTACGSSAPAPSAPPAPAPPPSAAEPPSNRVAPPPVAPPAPTGALAAWPVASFTPAQVRDVKGCAFEALTTARYPKATSIAALDAAFARHGACDDAVLAAACAARMDRDAEAPATCLDAYRAAVRANPAFAFAGPLIGPYFGKVPLVAAPPAAARPLTRVVLRYDWTGLGTAVAWELTARDLAGKPALEMTGHDAKPHAWSPKIATAIAGLGTSLTNFLPIKAPIKAVNCFDNYPTWSATLAFADGTTLELSTNGSNLLGLGGPWQLTVGATTYLQLGPDFVDALVVLIKALDLPIGQPMGQTCSGYDLQAAVLP
jgi:hypothetical protein